MTSSEHAALTTAQSGVAPMPSAHATRASLAELAGRYSAGDETALGEITPEIYQELKRVARNHLRSERGNHTLQATAVVNEAYERLCDQTGLLQQSRSHFFRLASRVMRNLLVDYARAKNTDKRGGGAAAESLDQTAASYHEHYAAALFGTQVGVDTQLGVENEFISLDVAMAQLRQLNPRQAEVVDLRFFGGLSIEEAAEALEVSRMTVKRDWVVARAFLQQAIEYDRSQA